MVEEVYIYLKNVFESVVIYDYIFFFEEVEVKRIFEYYILELEIVFVKRFFKFDYIYN